MKRLLGGCLWIAVLAAVPAFAQVQAGRVVGTIYDPNRAVVPGATVTVTDQRKNVSQRVTTNQTGDFVVTPLDPGMYSVSATATGFQTSVQKDIELLVGQSLRVDLELRLGEPTTMVEVKAEVALLNTESGTVGQVMSNTQIVDLPLNGRRFTDLARLTPGAAQVSATGNVIAIRPETVNGNTISGVRGRQVTFLLDGVDTSEQHQGGTYIQTSIDALQEFSVQQNAYSAEFSRAGGFFNATTKSGTNEFHGSGFEFFRNDKLDARNFFALKRDILKRNDLGGTFGGPVTIPHVYNGKDHTFFFVAYEAYRERQGLVFNNIVPTDAMKQGDFSASGLNRIYDPLSTVPNPAGSGTVRTPFAGNIIPANRLSAQALFYNKYIASPNSGRSNAVFAPSRALNSDQVTLRGDQELPHGQKFFARWSFHNNTMNDPNAYPALGVVPLHTRGQNVAAGLNGSFKPTLIHEFRFNYLPSTIRLVGFLQGTDFNAQAGVKGFEETKRPGVAGSFPDFAWSGYSAIQGSAFDQRPKTQDRLAYEFNDNLTWIKSKHILKFGVKVRYYQWIGTDSKQYVGSWSFTGINSENPASTAGTGDAFADWMLGYPASATRAFPGNTFGGQNTYWQFFAQDDFKVSSRLTLNLGLRYELTPWMDGYRNQVGTFDGKLAKPIIIASPNNQIDLDAQWAAPVAYSLFGSYMQTSSQAGLPLSITYGDNHQFGPRFGLAWRPFGQNTVVRGGYGIFYEPENTDGRVNLNMLPFRFDETALADRGVVPTRTFADFFLASMSSAGTIPGLSPTYTNMRMGYDQHWNLGIQQQVLGKLLFEVNYVGNKGSFLNASNDLNTPSPGAGTIQTRRPFPKWGSIGYNSQDMSTTYHSLQLKAEKRVSAGLWFLGTYTFSKTLASMQTSAVGGPQAWEKAIADFNVPHNFALSFGYELPVGKGKRFLAGASTPVDLVLGGWQLQGITAIRSGLPFTPTISRDAANTGVGGQRPNRIGSGVLDNHTLDKWFDQNAFVQPANFTYGNSGARILQGDLARVYDFSVFKNFQIHERVRMQFRAEFFNLPNTASFNPPGGAVDTASGARVTSTVSNPRQIQFGLKVAF